MVTQQFPKLFAGDYSAEVSALQAGAPDVTHSSFWGGDLEGLVIQNVIEFPAACVNPPAGMTSLDWIAQGFAGAECP